MKALSYFLSKLLQIQFKIRYWIFGIKESSEDTIARGIWLRKFPWEPIQPLGTYTDYPLIFHHYGNYKGTFQVSFSTPNKNCAFWLLQLENDKVQEIDVFETMTSSGVPGIYFSIYNNELSSAYYDAETNKPIYKRFQSRMRGLGLMAYLSTRNIEYSVKWTKKYVIWYIAGIPVAISFILIPHQGMHLCITNKNK